MSIDGIAGRVVLITGASRQGSIGMAIAETFVRAGAIVVISDIGRPLESFPEYQVARPNELEQSVQILRGMGPQTVIGIPCDVSSSTEVDALVDRVVGEFGRIDILINNAGIALGLGPITGVTDDQWHRNLEVMASGTFYGIRAAARHMKVQKFGRIINMSSQAGKTGWPMMSAYSAAKFAIIGLTQSAALELARYNITVNAICPGTVDTPLLEIEGGPIDSFAKRKGMSNEDARKLQEKVIPLGRFARPADIAATVFFLASEQGSFITGEAINVSGGEEVH